MTTNQMRQFVAVCDNLSFTKAAEALYISQPAISKYIASLEKELGETLFERHSKGKLVLTKAGEIYLSAFRASLEAFESAAMRVKYIDHNKNFRYRIGLVENWQLRHLVCLCREKMAEAFPDVQLDFILLPHSKLNSGRIDGSLDFVLTIDGAYSQVYGYTARKLTQIHPALLISASHPLAQKSDLTICDLQDELHFVLPDSETFPIKVVDVLQILDGKAPKWIEIPNIATVSLNILTGYGYTMFDEWSYEVHDPRFHAQIIKEFSMVVTASWKKGEHDAIANALFRQMQRWAADPQF